MIHIYYGQDKNNIKFEKMNINLDGNIKQTVFDGDYDKLLDAILQQSLFGEESVYLIDDAFFCLGKTNKDQDLLNNLLKSNKDIYCFCYDDKIVNKPHGITYHKVAKFNNLSKQKLINILLNKLSISFDNTTTKQHFETMIDNDPFVINNELTKLSLSTQNNIITRTQIDNFVSISNNPNIFQMMTFLLQNNKKQLIKLYENLILSKYQPIDLISIINTQLLNFKIYKLAKSKG
jgi:DNA polymerase III delta subunit